MFKSERGSCDPLWLKNAQLTDDVSPVNLKTKTLTELEMIKLKTNQIFLSRTLITLYCELRKLSDKSFYDVRGAPTKRKKHST